MNLMRKLEATENYIAYVKSRQTLSRLSFQAKHVTDFSQK